MRDKICVTPGGGGEPETQCSLPFAAGDYELSIDSSFVQVRPPPIQVYVRCPMANDRLVVIEVDKEISNLVTLELEIARVTGVPLKLIRSEGLYIGHGKRKRITSLSQLLEHEENSRNHPSIVVIHLGFAAGLLGGKGGFGSLLRSLAKNTKTTNFGSCRDLKGRRIRHVNQEEELKRWFEEKRERKNIDRERQKEYLSIKKKGRFMEKRMCTFGADCRYQWKCRYRHPGDEEVEQKEVEAAEREKVIQGPLTGFFGVANKPLKGVVGVSNVKKIRNDIMEGLKKQQSGKANRLKRLRSANISKTTAAQTPTTAFEGHDGTPQFKKPKLSDNKSITIKSSESSHDEFDDDDDLDLGLDIRGSLPACVTSRIKKRPIVSSRSIAEQKVNVIGSYIPSEEHVIISIDADFKETAKRLKRERRRKQREAEARKTLNNRDQIVGGWRMTKESTLPKAADLSVAPSDMFLDDIFEDGANDPSQLLVVPNGLVISADAVKNPDEIDLDDILCGNARKLPSRQAQRHCTSEEGTTPVETSNVDNNEINLDDLF